MRGVRTAVALAAVVAALTGCGKVDAAGVDADAGRAQARRGGPPGPPADPGTSPLDNPDGTRPGLAPILTPQERAEARALIDRLATKGRGPKTGYARDEFGYAWADNADDIPLARNGCDTRNDILARDGENLRYRTGSGCVLESMTVYDPYTGTTIEWRKSDAARVQIDHVVPLSYNWQMGASRWPKAQRVRVANDPLNLLSVDGRANSAKGDASPASWLPPNHRIRCAYVVRFAQVALKYGLPVTPADKTAMLNQCS